MTPNGQADTQYPHPLQMSGCTNTVSNSVRMIDPVGQASRQPAVWQCLHTSDIISHENFVSSMVGRSTNATWRHVDAPRCTVLSYDIPVKRSPSSGNWFHCLHATSHALQPMQTVVSVKNPTLMSSAPAAWADVRCQRFGLLDRHVRVGDEADELVDRVAGRESAARPVVRQADLGDGALAQAQRRDAGVDQ